MKRIYMDNGATTRVTEPVFEAMKPYFCEIYGNPSSAHNFGYVSRHAIDAAREQVEQFENCLIKNKCKFVDIPEDENYYGKRLSGIMKTLIRLESKEEK